jgi:hypothetical protein
MCAPSFGNELKEDHRKALGADAPAGPFAVDLVPGLAAFSEFVATVPLENLEMSEQAGLIVRSIILSSDADSSCDTPLHLAFYLSVRALSSNSRTWRCATK